MKKYALIKETGIVDAVVLAEVKPDFKEYKYIIETTTANAGWIYSNGKFTTPEYIPPPTPPTPPITQLEFLRRFTANERIQIRSSQDLLVIDFLHLLSLAQEIKLDDPDTVTGVGYLEQIGLIGENRADEILGKSSSIPPP